MLNKRSKTKVHLLIYGTYLPNGLCLILYYDHNIRYVQLYRTSNKEKLREISQDLKALRTLGVDVYSVTCDGHKSILRAVAKVYPDALIQRCLVHVKRQCRDYLNAKPKLEAGKILLSISQQLTGIKTPEQCSYWLLSYTNSIKHLGIFYWKNPLMNRQVNIGLHTKVCIQAYTLIHQGNTQPIHLS
ncbi:MAG: transposase [Chitinophagaceae bacterium]|nr:transposase [Chitinophagaceae bacterium]